MALRKLLPALALCVLSFFSCNPDCDSLLGLRVTTLHASEGDEILVTATPPNSLNGRNIFFNDISAESRYVEDLGLIVTVPMGEDLSGQIELRVEDPDCVDFVVLDFNVESEAFFENNPTYVFPPIPEIIIPSLPQDFPPSIENAWLHPENIDYCIWFTFVNDNGSCLRVFDSSNSFEQSTCYKNNPDQDMLYKLNPMSGYIDENDQVFMTIHRAAGEEHFEGRMVNFEDIPDKYKTWTFDAPSDCDPGLPPDSAGPVPERNHMMILTSLENGRQLLIYQQAIDKVNPTCD